MERWFVFHRQYRDIVVPVIVLKCIKYIRSFRGIMVKVLTFNLSGFARDFITYDILPT